MVDSPGCNCLCGRLARSVAYCTCSKNYPDKFNALRNGLLMIGLALGAIGGIYLDDTMPHDWAGFSVVIFTVLGGGIAYLAYFFIVLKMLEKEKEQ